jgi:hypothetical protein
VTSPFWQGLAVVLIFGLASSTFLVLTVFPYYYLGAEYLRWRISRKAFFKWLAVMVATIVPVTMVTENVGLGFLVALLANVVAIILLKIRKHRNKK